MFGWINDCTECLVVSKFGEETWHTVKKNAGCNVADGGFLRYKYYPDSDTVELVVAASGVLGISVDDVLYAFGCYFIQYAQDTGYTNVLECLGSNMRDWLSNLNSLHDHLQASYPEGFVAPVFWSEDDKESEEGAILVHYYSQRGSLLVPIVVGLLETLAKIYFDIDIKLTQLQLQDEDNGVPHTSWRVATVDPEEAYKLRGKKRRNKDDETITTYATTFSKCERTFREGGIQAANLRVEEFVKRSFYNEACGLFHALTLEQYRFLVEHWKTNSPIVKDELGNDDDKWCFEIWSLQEDDPTSWVSLSDLPYQLHPETIDPAHFGGEVPQTGAYPPEEDGGALQSFPPKLRIVNIHTERSVDLIVPKGNASLEDAIYKAPEVHEAQIPDFSTVFLPEDLGNGSYEIQCVVWNEEMDEAYHTFSLDDLASTTTQQLFDLCPKTFDPIKLILQCTEGVSVDDDEEDI